MKREKVSEDACKECPFFQWEQKEKKVHTENMIKNNICPKRDTTGCYDE